MKTPLLKFDQVTLEYRQFRWKRRGCLIIPTIKQSLVFNNLSWEIARGEMILLIGRNGTGKSTLLRAAAGLLEPTIGRVCYNSNHPNSISEKLVLRPTLVSDKTSAFYRPLTVKWNLYIWSLLNCLSKDASKANIKHVTKMFDLHDIENSTLMSLSSGQYQRFVLAAMLLPQPDIVLLDEPWRSIDDKTREILMVRLTEYIHSDTNRSVVLASHTSDWITKYFDRIIEVKEGAIALKK